MEGRRKRRVILEGKTSLLLATAIYFYMYFNSTASTAATTQQPHVHFKVIPPS